MDAPPPPDEELVERALVGDAIALELIVQRHMPAVLRHAGSKLNDAGAAEEVAQDTFVKADRSLHSFRREASLRTWLLRICERCCLDHLRGAKLITAPPVDAVLSLAAVRDDRDRQREAIIRSRLQHEINALPDDERVAFILVYVRGYSREEAAHILGIPPSTMRDRVIRARSHLAKKLADYRAEAGEG
jgi:RNA polymerase sigma-70 factor, ECF subfamily